MRRGRGGLGALLACIAVVVTGCGTSTSASRQEPVRVAAASDLQFALEDLRPVVVQQRPGTELAVTYASSGTLAQQIVNGAPFDLYLSADVAYVEDLAAEGLVDGDVFRYARGGLVLWVPDGSPVDPEAGLGVLADPAVRTVAIANPEHAPYGRAAAAALRHAGLDDVLADKVVLGESAAQATEFVRSGNADAGVVPRSLVLADPMDGAGRWWEVPPETFPPVEQGGAVLASARDAAAAGAVRDALLSPEGRRVLSEHGLTPVEGS
jgi:molybdate transport system substrate-binding protein